MSPVTLGKATPVRHVVFIFELLSLPESSQNAVILPQTIDSQKNLSARLHVSHETTRISRECPEDYSKTSKNFSRKVSQREDDLIIDRNNTQMVLHLNAQVFHHFLFVVVLIKNE